MRRRYRRNDEDDSYIEDLFRSLFGLSILGSLGLYFADRPLFYEFVAGLCVLILLIVIAMILWGRHRDRKFDATYDAIMKSYGSELRNFVDQFGREKAKHAAFEHRQYAFTEEHLEDLQDDLKKHGITVSTKNFDDILRRFIDELDRNFTLKSIHSSSTVRRFNDLDGAGFEALIKRLYEGAGYTAQITGRTGDQGGDLVVVREDAKKVIQAKLRRNMSVGNDAVQQVIAAKGIYNSPDAVVITNSTFTPEADELARVHGVELVDGKVLRMRLQETLGESWS